MLHFAALIVAVGLEGVPTPRLGHAIGLGRQRIVTNGTAHLKPADSTLDTTYDDSKMLVACLCFH